MRHLNSLRGAFILGLLYAAGLAITLRLAAAATRWMVSRGEMTSINALYVYYVCHTLAVLFIASPLTLHLFIRKRFGLYLEGAIAGVIAWLSIEARWMIWALAQFNGEYFWAWIVNSLEILAALPLLMWMRERPSDLRWSGPG